MGNADPSQKLIDACVVSDEREVVKAIDDGASFYLHDVEQQAIHIAAATGAVNILRRLVQVGFSLRIESQLHLSA